MCFLAVPFPRCHSDQRLTCTANLKKDADLRPFIERFVLMLPDSSGSKKSPGKNSPTGSFTTLDGLLAYLARYQVGELRMKAIRSPGIAHHSEIVRYHAVHLSSCVYTLPGTPIVYATFLAASTEQLGTRVRLSYPLGNTLNRDRGEVVALTLERELYNTIKERVLATQRIAYLDEDGQWDVPNPWSGLSKAFVFGNGCWDPMAGPLPSAFTVFP